MIGPHQGEQPIDVRQCGHVVSFGVRYTHETYPMDRIVGCQAILEAERNAAPYDKYLAQCLMEIRP